MQTAASTASPWIVSRSQDLAWFQGSALAGLALMGAFLALPPLGAGNYTAAQPAVWLLLFWGVVFDGTHVMATYARTYFAPDERSKAALPGAASFLWLALGPVVAIVDSALFYQAPSVTGRSGALFNVFLAAAYLWAYYHLIRQHYGFLCLYRRKQGEPSSLSSPDALFLWAGCAYPFLRYTLGDDYKASGLPVLTPNEWVPVLRSTLDALMAGVLLAGVASCVRRLIRGEGLGPKHLFLAIVVGFTNLVFLLLDHLLVITAVLTIFHNLQYHRIVWQYERGQGRVPMRSIALYAAAGLGLGLLWYGPRVLGVAEAHSDLVRNILIGFGWGVAFHHYDIDARIWRVRKQPVVSESLERGAAA
jgi:hypothetical protein